MNLTAAGTLLCAHLLVVSPTVDDCEDHIAEIARIGATQYRTVATIVLSPGDPPIPLTWECVTFAKNAMDIRQSLCWKPGQWTFDVHKGHWKRR